jgi:hypothetical protein
MQCQNNTECLAFHYDYANEDATQRCSIFTEEGVSGDGDEGAVCYHRENPTFEVAADGYMLM